MVGQLDTPSADLEALSLIDSGWALGLAISAMILGLGVPFVVLVCSGFRVTSRSGLRWNSNGPVGGDESYPWRQVLASSLVLLGTLVAAPIAIAAVDTVVVAIGSLLSTTEDNHAEYGHAEEVERDVDGRQHVEDYNHGWNYTVLIHSTADEPLVRARVVGSGVDEDFGTLDPGEWDIRTLRIQRRGKLEFSAEGSALSYFVTVDEIVTPRPGDRITVTLHPDGRVTLLPLETW